MNVQELIDILEDFDRSAEVRIAYQSNWPLAAYIENVRTVERDDEDEDNDNDNDSQSEVVWIAASDTVSYSDSPYAPRSAWDSAW